MSFPRENTGNPTNKPAKRQNGCSAMPWSPTNDQDVSLDLHHRSSCPDLTLCSLESRHLGHWAFFSFPRPKISLHRASASWLQLRLLLLLNPSPEDGVGATASCLPPSLFTLDSLRLLPVQHPLPHVFAVVN